MKTSFALWGLFLALSPITAQSALPPFIENELSAYIERGMEDWNIPAVAVGIIKDGEVVFAEGFGRTSAGRTLGEFSAEPSEVDAERHPYI